MIKETLSLDEIVIIRYAINYYIKTAFEQFHTSRYDITECLSRIDTVLSYINEFLPLDIYLISSYEITLLSKLDEINQHKSEIEIEFYEKQYIYAALSSYSKANLDTSKIDRRKVKPIIISKARENKTIVIDRIMRRWEEFDRNCSLIIL